MSKRLEKHKIIFLISFNIFLLFASIAGIEIALRILDMGYGNAPVESDPIMHHKHPADYRFLCHDPADEYGGFIVYYDNEGLISDPDKITRLQKLSASRRIAFLGDSFVEAATIEYAKSFVAIIDKHLKDSAIVKNYGVESYSPVLCYLQWRHKTMHFKPTHVFLMLCSNDCSDDEKYLSQALFSPSGEIEAVPGIVDNILIRILRKSYLARLAKKSLIKARFILKHRGRDLRVIDRFVEESPDIGKYPTKDYILRMAKEIESSGAVFILTAVPSKYNLHHNINDPNEFSKQWERWAGKNSVNFIDMVGPFRKVYQGSGQKLFYTNDTHFNAAGHAIIAEEIIRYLDK